MLQLYTLVLYIHRAPGYAAFVFRDAVTYSTRKCYISIQGCCNFTHKFSIYIKHLDMLHFYTGMLQLYTPVLYIHKALGYATFLFRDSANLHTSSLYIAYGYAVDYFKR
jgi:hypothetical protein